MMAAAGMNQQFMQPPVYFQQQGDYVGPRNMAFAQAPIPPMSAAQGRAGQFAGYPQGGRAVPGQVPPNMYNVPGQMAPNPYGPQHPQFMANTMQQQPSAINGGRGGVPPGRGPMAGVPSHQMGMPGAVHGYPPAGPPSIRQQGGGGGRGAGSVNAQNGRNSFGGASRPGVGAEDMPQSISIQQQLANCASPGQQKQLLGELLFPKVSMINAELAGKLTGMLLEMDNADLINL
jgi:polyadenylate-binding protein